MHYRNFTDISYASFCAISKAVNCDTVSQSPWSLLFNIPLAIWGLIGYGLFLIFLTPLSRNSWSNNPLWSILLLLALLYSCLAIFFGYISASKIQSFCILCILSYTINFGLLLYSWFIFKRFCDGSILLNLKKSFYIISRNSFLKYSLLILFFFIYTLKIFLPHYWQYQFSDPEQSLPHGITENGHPWIGATNPTFTIEEFSDYQCFQCAKMHLYLRQLVSDNPKTLRLVHRNYPMDHEVNPFLVPNPFHVGSARLALLSIAAIQQNKFWQVNDVLFKVVREKKAVIDIREIASQTLADPTALAEIIYAKPTIKALETDIRAGLRHKITGTPAYVINGEVYLGSIPTTIFEALNK
jgi:uncharacterized membrane protein/protein-disulfide isomerase